MKKSLLNYTKEQIEEYEKELKLVGSLSNLFSDNSAPLIYYRATENIYSRAFSAKNVSRADCTADAIFKCETGVGIKTFLYKPTGQFQKIAEFNKQASLYKELKGLDLIKKISELRNERIQFTMRNYGLKNMIYHCITRGEDGILRIFEEPLNMVDINNLKIISSTPNKYEFTDGIEKYEFYFSKSTLFKYFDNTDFFLSFKVDVFSDPIDVLLKLMASPSIKELPSKINVNHYPSLIVPLYSESKKLGRFVATKSGLNQWNAGGRKRKENEVYIPYPLKLREESKGFFPPRKNPWDLHLPNGHTITMTVCQQDGKALMSNPNKDLGQWLLRDVLKLKPGTLVTYDYLLSIGIDSVIFRKHPDGTYDCDFIDQNDFEDA